MEKLYYFCPQCDNHKPLKSADNRCKECGGKCLAVVASPEAVITEEDLEVLATESVAPRTSIHPEAVLAHRFTLFVEMGFDLSSADALANTREDTHRIRKMLREGCAIDVAVAILL